MKLLHYIRRHAHPEGVRQAGFTLLLAALVAAIVLAIGSSIFAIAQKQLVLSSIGRESQFAFYAADTGAECALYWDVRHDAFGANPDHLTPKCDGKVLGASVTQGTIASGRYTTEFEINLFTDTGYSQCVHVTIIKRTTVPFTTIRADGYNVSCGQFAANIRSLQRSVQLQY